MNMFIFSLSKSVLETKKLHYMPGHVFHFCNITKRFQKGRENRRLKVAESKYIARIYCYLKYKLRIKSVKNEFWLHCWLSF